nr:hypothetical protein [Staphylococcus argenteus]
MLKISLYAYTQSVFSGRRIEKLLYDSIRMMLIGNTLKHKLIKSFLNQKRKKSIV